MDKSTQESPNPVKWFFGPITTEEIKARRRELIRSASANTALQQKLEHFRDTQSIPEIKISEDTDTDNLLKFENLLDKGNLLIDLGLDVLKENEKNGDTFFTNQNEITFCDEIRGLQNFDMAIGIQTRVEVPFFTGVDDILREFKNPIEIASDEVESGLKTESWNNYDLLTDLPFGEVSSIVVKEGLNDKMIEISGEKSIDWLSCSLNFQMIKNETSLITTMKFSLDCSNSSEICQEIDWRNMRSCSLRNHNLSIKELCQGTKATDVSNLKNVKYENILSICDNARSSQNVCDNLFENSIIDMNSYKNTDNVQNDDIFLEVVKTNDTSSIENMYTLSNDVVGYDSLKISEIGVSDGMKNSVKEDDYIKNIRDGLKLFENINVLSVKDNLPENDTISNSLEKIENTKRSSIDEFKHVTKTDSISPQCYENASVKDRTNRKNEMLEKQFSEFCASIQIERSFETHSTAQNSFSDHLAECAVTGNVKSNETVFEQKATLSHELNDDKTIEKITKDKDVLLKKMINNMIALDINKTPVEYPVGITVNDNIVKERALHAIRLLNDGVSSTDKNKDPLKFSNNEILCSYSTTTQSDSLCEDGPVKCQKSSNSFIVSLDEEVNGSGVSRNLGESTGSTQSLLALSFASSAESNSFESIGKPESKGIKQFVFATPAAPALKKNNGGTVKSTSRSIRKPLNYFNTPPSIQKNRIFKDKNVMLPRIEEKESRVDNVRHVIQTKNPILTPSVMNKENISGLSSDRVVTEKNNFQNVTPLKSFKVEKHKMLERSNDSKRRFFTTPSKVKNITMNQTVLRDIQGKFNTEVKAGFEMSNKYGQWTERKVLTDVKSKRFSSVAKTCPTRKKL